VKIVDLHQCWCQNAYKRALQYALVSSLDIRVVIPSMNILLGRTIADKLIEYYGKVPSTQSEGLILIINTKRDVLDQSLS
jgi:hypothetical protein